MLKFILPPLVFYGFVMAGCADQKAAEAVGPTDAAATTVMDANGLERTILGLDKEARVKGKMIEFSIRERDLAVVYDDKANRMRIISPIAPAGLATDEVLTRMMQANFDSVLDTRYALANDIIWATFMHPLGSLTEADFISAIAQTYTAAETFGTTYSSGAIVFGGGDSSGIHADLLKELEKANANRNGRGI